MRVVWAAIVSLAFPAPALAQGGPPLLTDDPGTPGDGKWEVNLGMTFDWRGSEKRIEAPLIDINYGIGECVQLKLELPWVFLDDDEGSRNGLGSTLVGFKWRFLDEVQSGVWMSIYPQVEFNNPTSSADRGLVENGGTLFLPIQLQKTFGFIDANVELGYAYHTDGDDEWVYGIALGHQLSDRFELLAEIHGSVAADIREGEAVFNLGLRWKFSELNSLLLSAGRGLQESPDFIGYVALQFSF